MKLVEINVTGEEPQATKVSRFSIVDLAGSERYKDTNATGKRLKVSTGPIARLRLTCCTGSWKHQYITDDTWTMHQDHSVESEQQEEAPPCGSVPSEQANPLVSKLPVGLGGLPRRCCSFRLNIVAGLDDHDC